MKLHQLLESQRNLGSVSRGLVVYSGIFLFSESSTYVQKFWFANVNMAYKLTISELSKYLWETYIPTFLFTIRIMLINVKRMRFPLPYRLLFIVLESNVKYCYTLT